MGWDLTLIELSELKGPRECFGAWEKSVAKQSQDYSKYVFHFSESIQEVWGLVLAPSSPKCYQRPGISDSLY